MCSRRCLTSFMLCVIVGAPFVSVKAQQTSPRHDVLLKHGLVHRGDGSQPIAVDIAIDDGVISVVQESIDAQADIVLDCSGLVICPGFIDLHNHSDGEITERDTRANTNYLMQGCTTIVTGNCGFGPVAVGKYLDQIDKDGAGTNVAHLLPQGSLRDEVMGKGNRVPTDEELGQMRALSATAMQEGAFGMSTGLIYIPGTFTTTEELIEIARVIAQHKGIYVSHIRGEAAGLLTSVQEAIRIGHDAALPVHISHFKASGKPAWGNLRLAIAMVEEARETGQTVTADQYPYMASSTSLQATLIPAWAREGGSSALKKRLADSDLALRIRNDVLADIPKKGRIQIASYRENPRYVGLSLAEIAAAENVEVADLVLDMERAGGASIVHFGMQEDEIRSAMPLPWLATASDGGTKVINSTMPHPRSFGTFPRKIGHYAIAEQVITLPHAIRSATSLPAEILGLTDRGLIKKGMVADIAIFDPDTFRDRATFRQPFLQSSGIQHVLINGQLAVHGGIPTGRLAGRAVRKLQAEPATAR
jgi:N-acyl-D-amino-acid deacylase